MTKKLLSLVFLFLIISVLMSGCVQKGVNMEKLSERTDGSRQITVYDNPAKKYIHVTVVENTGVTDFGAEGLQKEITWLIPNPGRFDWPPIQSIGGENALSVRVGTFSTESFDRPESPLANNPNLGLKSTNTPDWYITAIAYPEKSAILTILTNGDAYSNNITWDIHNEMVNNFQL